jgi:ADP-heptose:LPS heptosyltransferase
LRALAALFPKRLTLICQHKYAEIFFRDLAVCRFIETDFQLCPEGKLFDADKVADAVGKCDLLLSLNPWHTASVDRLLQRLAPAASAGFFPAFRSRLPLNSAKHSADLAFDMVHFLNQSARIEDFAMPPALPPAAIEMARKTAACFPKPLRVIAVHADTVPDKMWEPTRLIRVLDEFLERHRDFVAFIVGKHDLRLNTGRHRKYVASWCSLPLAASMALVAQADLFLGVDSCMLHAADLFRIPGVGLFGPANKAAEFGFRFGPHWHVCGSGTMTSIETTKVLEALHHAACAHRPPIMNSSSIKFRSD